MQNIKYFINVNSKLCIRKKYLDIQFSYLIYMNITLKISDFFFLFRKYKLLFS